MMRQLQKTFNTAFNPLNEAFGQTAAIVSTACLWEFSLFIGEEFTFCSSEICYSLKKVDPDVKTGLTTLN